VIAALVQILCLNFEYYMLLALTIIVSVPLLSYFFLKGKETITQSSYLMQRHCPSNSRLSMAVNFLASVSQESLRRIDETNFNMLKLG
jgi:hypothetical protein